jgi:hypothetical protein
LESVLLRLPLGSASKTDPYRGVDFHLLLVWQLVGRR